MTSCPSGSGGGTEVLSYQVPVSYLMRALAIAEKVLGPEHPAVALVLENYAFLLRKMLRTGKAVELEERARAIRAKQTKSS